MPNVRLTVNGEEADYFDASDLSIKIFKSLLNTKDITARKGDYSLTIKVPVTARNRRIFRFIGELDLRDAFFGQDTARAEIYADESLLLRGGVLVLRVTPEHYEISVVGENIDFVKVIGSKNLSELESLGSILYAGAAGWPGAPSGAVTLTDLMSQAVAEDPDEPMFIAPVAYGNFFRPEGRWVESVAVAAAGSGLADGDYFEVLDIPGRQLDILFAYVRYVVAGGAVVSAELLRPGWFGTDTAASFSYASTVLSGVTLTVTTAVPERRDLADWPMSFDDFTPCTKVRSVIQAIFRDAGYTASGSALDKADFRRLVTVPAGAAPQWNWRLLLGFYGFSSFSAQHEDRDLDALDGIRSQGASFTAGTWGGNYSNIGAGHPLYNAALPASRLSVLNWDYSFSYQLKDEISSNEYPNDPSANSYICRRDGFYTFRGRVKLAGLWLKGGMPAHRIGFVIAKNNENNYLGSRGDGIVRLNSMQPAAPAFQYDPNVLAFQAVTHPAHGGAPGDPEVFVPAAALSDADIEISTGPVKLKAGDRVSFLRILPFQNRWTGGFTPDPIYAVPVFGTAASPQVEFQASYLEGEEELNLASLLPAVKQIDFLKSVITMFNWYFYVDSGTRTVTFLERDDFFSPAADGVFWDGKCDPRGEGTREPATDVRSYYFTYTRDASDWKADLATDAEYVRRSESRAFTQEAQVGLIFAPTGDRDYLDTVNGRTMPIPTVAATDALAREQHEGGWSYGNAPRILYYLGHDPDLYMQVFTAHPSLSAGNTSALAFAGLSWQNVPGFELGWPDTPTESGLYSRYYARTVQELERSYSLSLPVLLTPADIARLDVRRPVIIDGISYYLSAVQGFDPVTPGTTPVTLFRKF